MKIIVANWKMNNGFDEVDDWLEGFYKTYSNILKTDKVLEVVICPQNILLDYIDSELIEDGFHFLEYIGEKQGRLAEEFDVEEISKYVYESRPLKIGAQDCGFEDEGQYTGDISAKLLKEVNCEYVIVGHSERRNYHQETNQIVMQKASVVCQYAMTPIICVGESSEVRAQNLHFDFIKEQILQSVPMVKSKRIVIAYEPIWAIGTGNNATSQQIEEMAIFIRKIFNEEVAQFCEEFYVLYGGSVNSSNSSEILQINGIDGLLVGKASLNIEEFSKILLS